MVRHKRTIWYVVVAVVAGSFALAPAAVPAGGNGDTRQIPASGVTSFNPTPSGVNNGLQQPELGPVQADSASAAAASGGGGNGVNRSRSIEHGAVDVTTVPVTAGQGVSSTGPLSVLSTFDGLNHRQQRLANNRNQFSLEPPDRASAWATAW